MNEALKAATDDNGFQFFLARLFGRLIEAEDSGVMVRGYVFRERLYFEQAGIQNRSSDTNPDSHT